MSEGCSNQVLLLAEPPLTHPVMGLHSPPCALLSSVSHRRDTQTVPEHLTEPFSQAVPRHVYRASPSSCHTTLPHPTTTPRLVNTYPSLKTGSTCDVSGLQWMLLLILTPLPWVRPGEVRCRSIKGSWKEFYSFVTHSSLKTHSPQLQPQPGEHRGQS